jgi:hypothetical protein
MHFCAIVLAIAMLAISSVPASSVRVFGYGLDSCGMWTDARRTQNANNLVYASWVIGYLSGVNQGVVTLVKKDILVDQDVHALLAWIDNHCRANPLDKIYRALEVLVGELLKRAR